ncbi:MAG: hypothetical protein IJZ47_05520 [Oscillospiraceae bacterium]|nr:hypothetical protein [Oscillospiraceae bacterium]
MTTERKAYSSVYPLIIMIGSLYLGIFGIPVAVCNTVALVMVWVFKTNLAALYKNLLLMWALAIVTTILVVTVSQFWLLIEFLAIVASIGLCIIVCQNVREGIALMAVNPCLHFILIVAMLEWYAANIGFDEKLPMT